MNNHNEKAERREMEKRIAVFAGSFDPFTLGHLDLVNRAAKLFDELWIVVSINASKKNLFLKESRESFIMKACAGISNIRVTEYNGLIVNFMRQVGARYLIRGIRNSLDADYELSVHWNNQILEPEIETVYLPSPKCLVHISSSVVRELLKCGCAGTSTGRKKLHSYLPKAIVSDVVDEFKKHQ